MEIKASKLKFKNGLRDGVPIALGYLSVSFGFGISAASKGLATLPALLISMTNLTSAGQVAGLSVIVAAGTLVEIIMTQLIINLRYSLMPPQKRAVSTPDICTASDFCLISAGRRALFSEQLQEAFFPQAFRLLSALQYTECSLPSSCLPQRRTGAFFLQ